MSRIITWTVIAALVALPVPLERLWSTFEVVQLTARTSACAAGEIIRKK